jgi:hypothetical protein
MEQVVEFEKGINDLEDETGVAEDVTKPGHPDLLGYPAR